MNLRPIADEKDLLQKLRDGDQMAFEQLYHTYKRQLASNLVRLLGDGELARDALQDLFLNVWKRREGIDPDRPFKAYLFQSARNLVIDYYRKASADKQLQQRMMAGFDTAYSHVEEKIMRGERAAIVHRLIEQLPPERRQVFILHKIEGKSYKEITELLGIDAAQIAKHVYHSTRYLKQQLRAHPELLLTVLFTTVMAYA